MERPDTLSTRERERHGLELDMAWSVWTALVMSTLQSVTHGGVCEEMIHLCFLWFISKNLRVTFEICHMRGATPQYCQFTFINENMTWSQYGLALEFSENWLDLEMSLH